MPNQSLSTLYYDFIPTSFISQSVPINSIIKKLISNAVRGKYEHFDDHEFFPNSITLTPFIQYMEEKDAIRFINEFYKKKKKLTPKYERNQFCIERNLEIYFKSKATCFLVLGKPSPTRFKVAKYLAKKTRRHHLDAVRLVAREIIKNSPLGNWMWANLAWGKKIPDNIAMMLLIDELDKKKYQQRGYVLSGLPILTAYDLEENLLPFSVGKFPCIPPPYVRDKTDKSKISSDSSENFDEEIDFEYVSPRSDKNEEIYNEKTTKKKDTKKTAEKDSTKLKTASEKVLDDEWQTSSSEDENEYPGQEERRYEFAKLREHKLPLSEEAFTFSIEYQLSLLLDLDMPPDVIVYLNMEDNDDIFADNPTLTDQDKYKLLIQLNRYENALSCIQNFILHYNKETIIRIDSRLALNEIFHQLDNRLQYINYKKIYDVEQLFPLGIPDELQKSIAGKSLEDCLQILCETYTIQTNLNWLKSNFQTYCPVETYRGKHVRGSLQFAVRYLGYIYFLSSYDNMKAFISEPEKYFFSRPNCRIAIIGHNRTGKSTLAQHLKFLLKGKIYDVTQAICKLFGENSASKYSQAFKWAVSQAKEICKSRYECSVDLKTAKLTEWKENVLPHLQEALDIAGLCKRGCSLDELEDILQKSVYLKDLLPEECNLDIDYENLNCSDPLVNFFLNERLIELYCESLVKSGCLASDFITFAETEDEKCQTNTNGDKRYGQWIIDGAPLNLRFWEQLEENNCLPDIVIFLSNCSKEKLNEIYGKHLNKGFTNGRYVIQTVYKSNCHLWKKDELNQDDFFTSIKLITHLNECISKYSDFLSSVKLTENTMQLEEADKLEEFLKNKDIPVFKNILSNSCWSEIISETLLNCLSLFKAVPQILNFKDLIKLSTNKLHVNFDNIDKYNEKINEISPPEEFEVKRDDNFGHAKISEEDILNNIRLGNVGLYCPVLLKENNILIKGQKNLCVEYDNLVYFFYSEECLSKFQKHPERYAYSHNKPLIPAVKIWIVGPNSLDKTYFSLLLADELRIKSISFNKKDFALSNKLSEETSLDNLHELNNFVLSDLLIDKLKYFLKNGSILTGFPVTKEQFIHMTTSSLYPEAILIMNDQQLLNAIYNKELEIRQQLKYTSKDNDISETLTDQNEDVESDITQNFESSKEKNDKSENKNLTKAEEVEIYQLCKNFVESSTKSIRQIEELANALNIPVFKIPNNFKNPEALKDFVQSIRTLLTRFSLFDQIIEVSVENAMLCLNKGLFRYSRFGKSCPVDVDNLITVNHFIGSMEKKRIIPCIFREYIYFINGKKNLCKFKDNPFKYVNTCSPYQCSIPLRIAILGPKSSGCTTLCNRMAMEFGMQVFTKEDLKMLLKKEFYWTELYRQFVYNGNFINEDILAHCLMLTENATPNGIILNNFPLDTSYILKVAKYNLDFHIILVLTPNFEHLWMNWCRSINNVKNHSVQQLYGLHTMYSKFMENIEKIKSMASVQLFNIFLIHHMPCKWASWYAAKCKLKETMRGIVGFESNITNFKCASLSYVNIFEYELDARLSPLGPYCPICVKEGKLVRYRYDFLDVGKTFYSRKCQEEILRPFGYNSKSIYEEFKFPHPWSRNSNYPPLLSKFGYRRNLFLYQNHSYWSCDNHLMELLLNASRYLPINRKYLPAYVPVLVLTYLKLFLEHEGMCVVTYFKHLPNKIYVQGDVNYAIYYKGKIFLLASEKEALEFLQEPQKYYRIKLKLENPDDFDWDLENMKINSPNVSKSLITSTIIEAAHVRPKHFAMNTVESAAVLMALYLKIQNSISPIKRIIYESALKDFLKGCHILQNRLHKIKTYKNPFILDENADETLKSSY